MSAATPSATPHLRLVTTESNEGAARTRRARDLTQLPPQARLLRRRILAAALAAGISINPDAVSVILAAKLAMHEPFLLFTEDNVWDLIWFDICNWCGLRQIEVPDSVAHSLWFVLRHLHDSDQLHPLSDALEDLCLPLQSSSGLDQRGTPRFPA